MLLRDVCLTVGIQLVCKNYDIEEKPEGQAVAQESRLPFSESDLIEVNPIVKHLDIASDDVQANMEIVRLSPQTDY